MQNFRGSKKYINKNNTKKCRNPGSNQGPLDLQSNALPTELFRPHSNLLCNINIKDFKQTGVIIYITCKMLGIRPSGMTSCNAVPKNLQTQSKNEHNNNSSHSTSTVQIEQYKFLNAIPIKMYYPQHCRGTEYTDTGNAIKLTAEFWTTNSQGGISMFPGNIEI